MTRPAVILGLGGTGQWVLTYLKKDLMELNNGHMPENVRLIAIDTVTTAEASKNTTWESLDQKSYETSDKRIGSVQLDPATELIHIGGDCRELADEIEQGKYPWMNWFDVKYWKYEAGLGRDNWFLDRGAGRFRQFGLLAVYKDLMRGDINSEILKTLPSAIRDVQAKVKSKDESFELIIVSSVAGGTGSAMLVPLGVLAQKLFGIANVKTRAIVVLPTAFSPGKRSTELELRGGAALRELARSMMPPNGYSATLDFGHPEYRDVKYSRPFDGIYFVDGTRDGKPINKDPKYVVFPAVAGWVRQILDETSGEWFTAFGSTNLKGATDYTRLAEGVFGVFGIKSLYMPVRTLRQTYRLKLTDRAIRHVVKPITVTDVKSGLSRQVADRNPIGEIDATAQAYSILMGDARFGDEQVLGSALTQELGRIVKIGGKNEKDEVSKKAFAGLSGRDNKERMANSWFGYLRNLPDTPNYSDIRHSIDNAEASPFGQRFVRSDQAKPPRKPDSALTFSLLTGDIDTYVTERLGGKGARGDDDYGNWGQTGGQACMAHEVIFRQVLRLNVLRLLSAEGEGGRLGYTIEVLRKIEQIFADFLEFLVEVKRQRETAPGMGEVIKGTNVSNAKTTWTGKRRTQPTLFEKLQGVSSAEALAAEKNLLIAWNNHIYAIQEIALHNLIETSAKTLKDFTEKTRKELERWEATLLEGDRATGVSGLLSESASELKKIETSIHEDFRTNDVEELVAVDDREAEIPNEDVEWATSGMKWNAHFSGNGLAFRLSVEPEANEKGELSLGGNNSGNLRRVEGILQQRFGTFGQVENVLVWCAKEKSDIVGFASELASGTIPLTNLANNAQPAMQTFSVSVKKDEDPTAYCAGLETELRKVINRSIAADNNRPVDVINSADPYRITAVRTQLGLKLDEFKFWELCQDTYQDQLKSRVKVRTDIGAASTEQLENEENRRLANFLKGQFVQTEEKKAVDLEVKWREDGLTHRVLNPRLVSLLGKEKEFRAALQCWAMGWVQEVEDAQLSDQYHWELKVPGWEYDFWITPNGRKGEKDELQVLEALVLVGQNSSRDYHGNPLVWDSVYPALRQQRIQNEEKEGKLQAAIKQALEPGFLIDRWEKKAHGTLNAQTNYMEYQNPAYHDLADYSKRYFKNM